MKYLIITLILLVFGSEILLSDCESEVFHTPIYALSKRETDFVRDFYITNLMKNLQIHYNFSEFYLCSAAGFEIIPFKLNVMENYQDPYIGSSGEGIDTVLSEKVISYKFTIPDHNPRIAFFRFFGMQTRTLSDEVKSRFPEEARERRYKFYADTNLVSADQTFVIRMLDAYTNETLMILDSVGVMQNRDSYSVPHFGRDLDSNFHFVDVPNDLSGREVYLQLFPKRYGSITLTAKLMILPNFVSRSYYSNIANKLGPDATQEEFFEKIDSLKNVYFYKLIAYMDSSLLKHREMPKHESRLDDDLENKARDLYRSRYFHLITFREEANGREFIMPVTLPAINNTREDVIEYIERRSYGSFQDSTLFNSIDEFVESLKPKLARDTYRMTLGGQFEKDAEYFVRVVNTDGGTVDYLTLDHADIAIDISNYEKGIYYAYTYKNDAPIAIDKFKIE